MINWYEKYTSTTMLQGFDEEKLTQWSENYFKHHIYPHLLTRKAGKVLEIGCGYGRYVKTMQNLGFADVRGIDISEEQIRYAQRRLGLTTVAVSDAMAFLEHSSERFDAVLLLDVLEHLDDEYSIQLIRAVHNKINAGGCFVVQVPNAISPLSVHRYGDITHKRAYTTHSMAQCLLMGGFTEFRCFPLPPFSWDAKSWIRTQFWRFVINPAISFYLRLAVGGRIGGIYTENLLAVAIKEKIGLAA